jgi:ketosteroid isomerase-like protein
MMNTTQQKTTPKDVLATYFDSWREKDVDSLRSIPADDVTFAGPLGTAGNAAECVSGIERLSQITTAIDIRKVFVDGTDVLTWFELHTTIAPPTPVANWSRVEDGKIVRIRVTFDPREMLKDADG